jgi:hypothetical protein
MLQSAWSVALAAVVLPPAGFVLLWLRSGAGVWKKVAGSALIAGWSVAWMMLFFGLRFQLDGSGIRPVPNFYNRESHYSELERSRAGRSTVPVVQAAAAPAGTQPQSAYWTDFRGPHRDGRYDQTPILTEWPPSGLPLVWKQPVGGGYASFVIAHGRALRLNSAVIRRPRQRTTWPADGSCGPMPGMPNSRNPWAATALALLLPGTKAACTLSAQPASCAASTRLPASPSGRAIFWRTIMRKI